MKPILLVEDEPKVARAVQQGLTEAGYPTELAFDGAMGKRLADRQEFSLYILDLNLPEINGYALCQHIRRKYPLAPILMLTALGETEDKLEAFSLGADDYLVKPFDFRELLARVQALLKRTQQAPTRQSTDILYLADLELDRHAKSVKRGGQPIALTAKEFHLLEYLLLNQGRVISKAELAEKIWDITFDTGTNVIEVYVNFLRKKVDKDFDTKLIHTRSGLGYLLKAE